MAEIGIKDLKAGASRVIDEVAAGASYVVTKRGKPAAVIVPVEDAEDLVLANVEEYVAMRRLGREEYREKLPVDARKRVRNALDRLAADVASAGRVGGKRVKTIRGARDSVHRLRVGDYRVLFDVLDDDRVVLVLGVVHRGDLERWLRSR